MRKKTSFSVIRNSFLKKHFFMWQFFPGVTKNIMRLLFARDYSLLIIYYECKTSLIFYMKILLVFINLYTSSLQFYRKGGNSSILQNLNNRQNLYKKALFPFIVIVVIKFALELQIMGKKFIKRRRMVNELD